MNLKPVFVSHAFLSILLGASLVLACSSDDGTEGGAGSGGSNDGLDPGIDDPGGNGPRVGGSRELSEEEVSNILGTACTGGAYEGESLPAILQLVVDTSRSMTLAAPGGGGSRWQVTRSALEDALDELPPSVAVGMLFYPNYTLQGTQRNSSPGSANDCVDTDAMIPIAPLGLAGSAHRELLADAFANATIDSYTPTHDAYSHALQNGLLPYQGSASKFMLVITDGAPTLAEGCVNPVAGTAVGDAPTDPIISDIQSAREQHGVHTFLIGVPGSEESSQGDGSDMRPWLSRAAMVGGTAPANCQENGPNYCHMDMTQEQDFSQSLRSGLASIAGQIIDSCTFVVPSPPAGQTIDPDLTAVVVTWESNESTLFLGDDTGDCSVGWEKNGDNEITLCPQTCDAVRAAGGARLHLAFGCGEEIGRVR